MISQVLYLSLLPVLLAAADKPPAEPAKTEPKTEQRSDQGTELNLLGKVDTEKGESRRNENIQFNLVDNNALKELNIRLGATATIIEVFRPERGYFSSEFGNPPGALLYVAPTNRGSVHGSLFESHRNSAFSARSFFQVGGLEPAHDNDYGFNVAAPLWRGADVLLEGGQARMRGSVNGNALVPLPNERTPLVIDPATVRGALGDRVALLRKRLCQLRLDRDEAEGAVGVLDLDEGIERRGIVVGRVGARLSCRSSIWTRRSFRFFIASNRTSPKCAPPINAQIRIVSSSDATVERVSTPKRMLIAYR